VLQSKKPFEQGLHILPIAYGLTVAINIMSIALDGPKRKYFRKIKYIILFQDTKLYIFLSFKRTKEEIYCRKIIYLHTLLS